MPNSVPFSKPEGKQKYQIRVSNHTVADVIRKLTGWHEDENWNIPGIYFAEEYGIMYDLTTAYKPKPRGGWAAKRAKEAGAAATEALLEERAETESKDCMRQLVRRADFPAVKVGGKYLVSREGLKEWLAAQTKGGGGIGKR